MIVRSPGRSAASTASSETGPAVALVANSVLDRYPADLQAIPWHLLIADEALRYANPATEAHHALAQLRFGSVADCWLLDRHPAREERGAPRRGSSGSRSAMRR